MHLIANKPVVSSAAGPRRGSTWPAPRFDLARGSTWPAPRFAPPRALPRNASSQGPPRTSKDQEENAVRGMKPSQALAGQAAAAGSSLPVKIVPGESWLAEMIMLSEAADKHRGTIARHSHIAERMAMEGGN